MSNVFSFYFDGSIVQAVKASVSGGFLTVIDAHTFPQDELDAFLSACKEKEFIVCCNPLLFHQDVVHLPPAASRQHDKLARSEVMRIHPELDAFTTFHTTAGQATIDGKVYSKIAVFSYLDESLDDFMSLFSRNGKVISHIYAAPYSIFKLFASAYQDNTSQSRIFIAALPGEKLFLTGENNELVFIRKIPSSDAALMPADIQNINMTLDYCFQTLRVRPVEAVTLSQADDVDFAPLPQLSIPLTSTTPPALKNVPEHLLAEYIAPLAAALHATSFPRMGDILPADYVAFSRNRKILIAASAFMVALALPLAGYTVMQWMAVSDLKSAVRTVRSSLNSAKDEIAAYRKLDAEVQALSKPLEILNKQRTSPHPAAALAALVLPSSQEFSIKGISIRHVEGYLTVQIDGSIDASGFSNVQATFEWVIEQVGKIPGYKVLSSALDIKQKSFKIQARYDGVAPKGK